MAPAGSTLVSPTNLCGPPRTSVIEKYEYSDYTDWTFDCTGQWAGSNKLIVSSVIAVASIYYAAI